MPISLPSRHIQRGSMLLEALISILIFSIGILGIVGLQANSIKISSDAKYRSDASLLANQYLGSMWGAVASGVAAPSVACAASFNVLMPQGLGDFNSNPAGIFLHSLAEHGPKHAAQCYGGRCHQHRIGPRRLCKWRTAKHPHRCHDHHHVAITRWRRPHLYHHDRDQRAKGQLKWAFTSYAARNRVSACQRS